MKRVYIKIKRKFLIFINHIKFVIKCFKSSNKIIKPLIIREPECIFLKNNIRIKQGARIECYKEFAGKSLKPQLNIGDNVIIGYNFSCLVADEVNIGKNTILASNVLITTENHGMNPEDELPYHAQPLSVGKVKIGEGCWIGENVKIMPNVEIGNKTIIAAGAIVTKSIPEFSIAAGVPAKVIKQYDFAKHIWK